MKKKRLLLTLLTLLCFLGGARAQQALPYEYGFESDLATDGWTATSTSSGINSGAKKTGSNGFRFAYSITSDAYLVSPILTGGTYGVDVSFYYKAYSGSYPDHFKVGYTTNESADPSEFTYGDLITSTTSWTLYENTFPAGTVRIAILYDTDNYDDGYYLYLDDFSFTAASPYVTPTGLTATDVTTNAATISWTASPGEVTGYAYQYKKVTDGDEGWSTVTTIDNPSTTSATLSGLAPGTTYNFRVKALYGSNESVFATINFTTDCPVPYAYGFENTDGINCWTIIGENYTNAYDNDWANDNLGGSFSRTGNNFFFFFYTENPPQYLISPQLSGIVNGLHVEFYYRQYTNGVETFQVGYSTTDNNPASFTWGDEITASTSYQRFSANYPKETKYVAVKHTSDDQYYLFLDDFLFEESASVLEPTGVTVSNATTTSASISWTAGGTEPSWDLYITSDNTDVPDESTVPTVTGTSSNPYALTGLTPATYYYVYVRANTGAETSAWSSPAIFNTKAEPIALPYNYDFQDNDLPIGWNIINTNTSYNAVNIMKPSNSSDNKVLSFYIGTYTEANLVAVLPEVDAAYPLKGYQITFDACYAQGSNGGMTSGKLRIGIMTDPTDFETFTMIKEVDITDGYNTSDSQLGLRSHTVYLNHYTGNGQYIAIQDVRTQNGYVLVDNIEVSELPACIPPTGLEVTAKTATTATLSWTAATGQDTWQICLNGDEENLLTVNANPYTLTGLTALTDYTVKVRAYCSVSDQSSWSDEVSFTTRAEVSSFPWTEDFEGFTVNTVPISWDNSASTSPTISLNPQNIWGVYSYNDNKMLRMYNYFVKEGTALINSPMINLPNEGAYELTFDYAHNASCGDFTVKISEDGGTTFTDLHSYSKGSGNSYSAPGEFTPASISLADYAGKSIILQFYAYANYDTGAIFIDNINIDLPHATIKMNNYGIMTYAYDAKLDFGSVTGLKAYAATGITGADLTMTEISVASAGAGLMLKGDADANYSVYVTDASADAALGSNMLVGLTSPTLVNVTDGEYTTFILADGSDGVNWYQLEEDYTLKANSAYLELKNDLIPSGARGFGMIFDDGTSTAINLINSGAQNNENGMWYTLQGLRLDKQPTTKGIYIHNGKKVVIK